MIELLDKTHKRKDFDCGNVFLNNYLKYQAGQVMKRKLSACFVLAEKETNTILGFYTLSNNSIPLDNFPEQIKKKLPKSYKSIPATLLGRLAINKNSHQGKGFGKFLLIDALKRSYEISREVGSFAVVVDPIDKEAELFYETAFNFFKMMLVVPNAVRPLALLVHKVFVVSNLGYFGNPIKRDIQKRPYPVSND